MSNGTKTTDATTDRTAIRRRPAHGRPFPAYYGGRPRGVYVERFERPTTR
ncbi:MAG: hypothetical protein S0880_20375 [Actinomycetota bacterium]|nr:hypothetical protein [Actinomycetota bacterium]